MNLLWACDAVTCIQVARVPTLIGTNRNEGSTFTANQTGTGDDVITLSAFYDHWLYDSIAAERQAGYFDDDGSVRVLEKESQFVLWASGNTHPPPPHCSLVLFVPACNPNPPPYSTPSPLPATALCCLFRSCVLLRSWLCLVLTRGAHLGHRRFQATHMFGGEIAAALDTMYRPTNSTARTFPGDTP